MGHGIELRKYPYPYRCAVALSNDAEYMTPTAFWDLHQLLDRLELEVTDSAFMYSTSRARSFSYFRGTEAEPSAQAGWMRDAMRAGLIDTLHSWGDFDEGGFCRAHALRAAEELTREGLRPAVWTHHGCAANTQNLGGPQDEYQRGDLPDAAEYHADLTLALGVEFFALDADDVCLPGHDSDWSLRLVWREARREPRLRALRDRLRRGRLLGTERLRDGRLVRTFRRYRGPWRPDVRTLARQLAPPRLDHLAESAGCMVVYQHLGCDRNASGCCRPNRPPYFDPPGLRTLEDLSARHLTGQVWVTGLHRLLRYRAVQEGLRWSWRARGGGVEVVISGVEDPIRGRWQPGEADLEGVTFLCPQPARTEVWLEGQGSPTRLAVRRHALPGGAGALVVPWRRLELPPRPSAATLEREP